MFDVRTNEKLYSHQHHLLFIVLERPRGDVCCDVVICGDGGSFWQTGLDLA